MRTAVVRNKNCYVPVLNSPSTPSLASGVLLGFFFASTAALSDYVRVEQNLKDKMLVVVGSRFALELVFNLFARVLLNNFL